MVSRININGVPTIISLGIDEDEIERNEIDEDTIRLDDVVEKTMEVLDGEIKEN